MLSFQKIRELTSVNSWIFQVSCPALNAGLALRITTPDGVAPGGPLRDLSMDTGLLCPPVLGMVARQFLGWSPASSWVGRPLYATGHPSHKNLAVLPAAAP